MMTLGNLFSENRILQYSAGNGGSGGNPLKPTNILALEIIPPNLLSLINKTTEELPCDEAVSKTFTAPECQRIHKIYTTNSTGTSYTEIPVTNRKTMTVSFPDMKVPRNIRVIYTNDSVAISTRSGTGGSTDKDNTSPKVCRGKDYEINITPQAGYEVDFVTNNNVSIGGWSPEGGVLKLTDIQNPQNIEVAFKKKKYTVSISAGSGGSASPISGQVEYGDSFQFNISPSSGYKVKSVTANGSGLSFSVNGGVVTIPNITQNQLVSVQFEKSTVSVTVTRIGSGNVSHLGTREVQIGSNLSVSASATSGSALVQVLVNGVNRSFSSATGSNTISVSNITTNTTVQIRFITVRQSLGFIAYPSNSFMMPILFRNNGLQVHLKRRSGDSTTAFHNQGFGVDNAVTRIQYWDGTSMSNLTLRSDYSSTRSDYRDKMASHATNQYHKLRVSRTDGGYFEANGRAVKTSADGVRNVTTRTVRVYLHNMSNGNLVFRVTAGAQDANGTNLTSGISLALKVNGTSVTITNKFGTQDCSYNGNLNAGTHTVRVEMRVSGDSTLYYCEGTYRIL